MPKLGDLVARIRLRDDTRDGVDAAEGRITQMLSRVGAAAAAVGVALARGIIDAIEDVEQRLNTLEQRLGRTAPFEAELAEDLTRLGFGDEAVAAGVQATRQLGRDPGLAEDIAALETAGINTRFVPQLARAFGLSDAGDISAQLNAAFDLATRSGSDPEELLSEIADNPQVYAAFGSIPQAVDFVARQPLIPSETTIQLEQGALVPEQIAVDADVEALSAISPSFGERSEGRLRTRPTLASIAGGLEALAQAVPVVGGTVAEGVDVGLRGGAYLGERLGLAEGSRTVPADIETFNVPVADLLLELETRDAAAAARVDRIANRIDLDRRRNGSAGALDIPG